MKISKNSVLLIAVFPAVLLVLVLAYVAFFQDTTLVILSGLGTLLFVTVAWRELDKLQVIPNAVLAQVNNLPFEYPAATGFLRLVQVAAFASVLLCVVMLVLYFFYAAKTFSVMPVYILLIGAAAIIGLAELLRHLLFRVLITTHRYTE